MSLTAGLDRLRDLINRISKESFGPDLVDVDELTDFVLFGQKDEGWVLLSNDEALEYRQCLNELSSSIEDRYSRKAVEQLMQTAILKALDIKKQRTKIPFEKRLESAIKELQNTLKAKPTTWTVHLRVEGLAPAGLPKKFGKVEFYFADEARIKQLIQDINTVIDLGANNPEVKKDVKSLTGQKLKSLTGATMASLKVSACDPEAAWSQARRELRLTMDVLNFYSDILFNPKLHVQIYFPGELQPVKDLSVIFKSDMHSISLPFKIIGPLSKMSLDEMTSERAQQVGLFRADGILKKDQRTEVEERVLAALQWAGRATVNTRAEEAFLQYAIALECITLGRKDHTELRYRLAMRTALLVGNTLNVRKLVKKEVTDLYDIRSKIVHTGSYEVTNSELSLIRYLAKKCILRVLTEEPFLSMKKEDNLNAWFDEAMLSYVQQNGRSRHYPAV
ncbi:MAG: hypothetical protein J7J22_06515 [Candidatus Verstraetearchaeota archaeon]|nr:hypothetical protein [Candidatus Verstraetearchaeota archaeon]